MLAAILEAPGKPLVIADDIDIDGPEAGEVLVKVHACGLCHSDVSVAGGTPPVPIIVGHEAAGVVEAVGPGVTRVKPGDPVMLTPCPPCGHCYWCLRGEHSICVNASAIATAAFPDGRTRLSRRGETVYRGVGVGAFAEFVLTQESGAVPLPPGTALETACVIGCAVQTGVGAVLNCAKVEEGATVLVMGLGGIGIAIVQGARLAGASRIIVSDPIAARRDAAAHFGATDAIDPTTTDVREEVLRLTGVGADYAFDAVGSAALIETGLWATRNGGTTVMVGAAPLGDTLTLEPVMLLMTEKRLRSTLLGSSNSPFEVPRLINLWRAGCLDLDSMVTAVRPLAEINDAIDDLGHGRGIRTVLTVP
ncbi:MAG TPA: Zn-dependent alcohol dehydrogenase [Acidimicrobiales bacterium]|nr:Zn-dependent alcohol dehydrogenase [Acidimicrobiales bacterium]